MLEQDIYNQLVVAYVAKLRNNITLNGEVIPIRNAFASGSKYIMIQGFSGTGVSNKSMTRSNVAIQFSVFLKGDDLVGNEADNIAGQLIQLVLSKPNVTVIDNNYFEAIATIEATNIPFYASEGDTATKILERKIVIEHRVIHKQRA